MRVMADISIVIYGVIASRDRGDSKGGKGLDASYNGFV